eukprot:Opistho-1_new@10388
MRSRYAALGAPDDPATAAMDDDDPSARVRRDARRASLLPGADILRRSVEVKTSAERFDAAKGAHGGLRSRRDPSTSGKNSVLFVPHREICCAAPPQSRTTVPDIDECEPDIVPAERARILAEVAATRSLAVVAARRAVGELAVGGVLVLGAMDVRCGRELIPLAAHLTEDVAALRAPLLLKEIVVVVPERFVKRRPADAPRDDADEDERAYEAMGEDEGPAAPLSADVAHAAAGAAPSDAAPADVSRNTATAGTAPAPATDATGAAEAGGGACASGGRGFLGWRPTLFPEGYGAPEECAAVPIVHAYYLVYARTADGGAAKPRGK